MVLVLPLVFGQQRVEQSRSRAEVRRSEPRQCGGKISQSPSRGEIENTERAHDGKALGTRGGYAGAVVHQNEISFQQLGESKHFCFAIIQLWPS